MYADLPQRKHSINGSGFGMKFMMLWCLGCKVVSGVGVFREGAGGGGNCFLGL